MITYNGIIEYFKEVANKHLQINSFSFGDIDDADLEKIEEYPLLHVGVTGANIDERVISYDINIMLIEIVDDKDKRKDNEKYALSNTLQILQDLQTEFLKGNSIVTPDTKLTGNALSCTPITGNYNNRVVGWSTVMTIEGANESEPCNIPYMPMLSWDYETPTPPIDKLNTGGYTWYSATEKQEGNIDYANNEYVREWLPIVDGKSIGRLYGSTTNDGSIEYQFKNKAINIQGIDPVVFTASQSTISLNDIYFIKINQITGGLNKIFSLKSNQEEVEVRIINGVLQMKDSEGTAIPLLPNGVIHGLQANNPKLTDNDAIVRDTPYTFAIKIQGAQKVRLYYGNTDYAELDTDDTITGLATFFLGNKLDTAFEQKTNFNVQELIYTNGTMSDTTIEETIEWLNAK